MHATEKGLVLTRRKVGRGGLLVTVLTGGRGVIRAFTRTQGKQGKLAAAIQPLSFSEFVFFTDRDRTTIEEGTVLEPFFALRTDVVRLSLGVYLSDLAAHFSQGEDGEQVLLLTLHALHALTDPERNQDLIKAAFELRIMAICGFMPDLSGCHSCGRGCSGGAYFYPELGCIACKDCGPKSAAERIAVSPGVLLAMRHITQSEPTRVFAFTLASEGVAVLNLVAERYIVFHTGKEPQTLNFYKSLL